MDVFWFAAAGLAAATALLVMVFGSRAARRAATGEGEDPSQAVYRRQLREVAGLAERGLLDDEARRAAEAEGARRLLASASQPIRRETSGGRWAARLGAGGAVIAALLSLGLYLAIGSPGMRDQPYRARLSAWRSGDPAQLDAERMAAVLQALAAERPRDAAVFDYLGRAELAAGDAYQAERADRQAIGLEPKRADLYVRLGQALVSGAEGKASDQAEAAFAQALALDPRNEGARYLRGQAEIASGQTDKGAAEWEALLASLSATDPRRPELQASIASVRSGTRAPSAPGRSSDAGTSNFIRGMVASLAARLKAQPDDPAGWARLVRSYGVLHEAKAQADTLAAARRQFTGRPDALRRIEAEAAPPPQSP